jgi:hypothetical protein
MSITLELRELSPEAEKQLAAMPEEERNRLAITAIEKQLSGKDDDGAMMIGSPDARPNILSPEEAAAIRNAQETPAQGPTEAMKAAVRRWKELTGRELPAA